MQPEDTRLESISIEEEMQASFIDYSMSVIRGRALPDVRDGLKPVHRRVLFAMRELGNQHDRPYKKSARVVGDTIGKYHPHGDMAVYDTIVRLAQDFSMRHVLVDGQGNFGSVDGDPPAQMRYTEVRMDRLAEELLADLDRDTVDFVDNYDGSLREPEVLPGRVPNLLLNGSSGIAVGMATNIPPHNLNELADAIVRLIDHPGTDVDGLMKLIKGPDFPTGGVICGVAAIQEMYRTGRGQLRVRGKAGVEETAQGKQSIIVSEIPYAVNKARLLENLAHLVQNKKLEGIADLRDESNREGIRIVVELKRGAIPKVVLNNIYKHTQMQTTFGAIMLAIDRGEPKILNLKELLHCFIEHRFGVITRRTQFDLRKAEARAHILEGLKIALDQLDAVVRVIRESPNRDAARDQLMRRFGLSEVQANAILDMRLYQLTGLEREKVENEYLETIKHISYLKDLLANRSKIYGLVREETLALKQEFGDARRTEIVPDEGEVNIEDLIADRSYVITVSHRGYVKRVAANAYKAQRRGGKGVAGMGTREEDYVEHLFIANTHDYILFFTAGGRLYWEKVYEIPEASRTSRGKAIVNLLEMRGDETLAAMLCVRDFPDREYLIMATERGVVKKTALSAYSNPRRDGIIAINVDAGDRVIGVRRTSGAEDVMLTTRRGQSIRFAEAALRSLGRATRGVKGISLGRDDAVVGLVIVDPAATLLVCSEHGYGKRTAFGEYRLQSRGGRGVMTMRTSRRNGMVVSAHAVSEHDSLMLITANGKMIRMAVSDVRVIGRVTQGVRLINLDERDTLVSATTVEPESGE